VNIDSTDASRRDPGEGERQQLMAQRQLALDAAKMGWWEFDPQNQTASFDARAREIFGISGVQHPLEEIRRRILPDDFPGVWTKVEAALNSADPQPYQAEYRIRLDDGSVRWVEAHGAATFEGKGPSRRAVNFAGTITDVSERQEAQAAIRSAQERWELAVDAMGVGLWAMDLNDHSVEESDQFVAMLGLPPGTRHTDARELGKYLHPEDRQRAVEKFEAAVREISDYEDEHRLIGADGVTRWVHVKGKVIGEGGKPSRTMGVVVDVSSRRRDEEARAHLAAIVTSSDDAIISKTLDGIIQTWNAGAQRIFGYTAEEVIGKPVLILLPADRKEEEVGILARLRRGERIDHYESVRITKDGRLIDVSLTISPVKDESGRIIGASKIARDITESKLAGLERDRLLESERFARGEAERQGRLKDEFVSTLSHELRTPLNAIMGYAHLLRRDQTLSADAAEGVAVIERNARVQAQIVEDILDVSRIVSGKMRLDVQPVDLHAVIEAAVETCIPAADAKGIRLARLLDPLAGPVSGDPARLQQCVWNLVSNSIKFSPRGGRVQVVLQRVDSHVEILISDTGQGIKPEFLPYVFDRFRQADASTTRQASGLGLGLSIVKSLVELHGGTVQARSEGENRGATFIIRLPLSLVQASPPDPQRRHPRAPRESEISYQPLSLEGLTVLTVDDESDARDLVRRLLEECGAKVVTAGSVDEAMRVLDSGPVNLLISDIGMPRADGYELVRRVRQRGPERGGNLPAIALTAYARSEDRTRAMLAGFVGHVSKPVEPAELIATVASLARRG
jgi:PAS domain S-box-containing protein